MNLHLTSKGMATVNALDVGPPTLLDTKPSVIDPVVLEIVRILDEKVPNLNDDKVEVEVELRLGLLQDNRTGDRLELPISSEAMLQKRSDCDLDYSFLPGMPMEAFHSLGSRLQRFRDERPSAERRRHCRFEYGHFRDVIYLMPGVDGIARTTENVANPVPNRSCIIKTKLANFELYTGRRAWPSIILHNSHFEFVVSFNLLVAS